MSPRRELLRHFLDTFFDSEALAASGEWKKSAIGVLAAFLSAGILVLNVYSGRYAILNSPAHSTAALYRTELRSDLLLFIGLAFAVTAVLTLLQWQSLFPNRRDCLALAGLPISARDIFLMKSGALTILFSGYVLSINLPWAILFTTAISGGWQENPSTLVLIAATFVTMAGACCFAFLILLALQGLLLNLLPARIFDAVSLWIQGILFISTLGTLPLASRQPHAEWWPGTWFLHLWEAIVLGDPKRARTALLSIAIPAVVTIGAYLAGYHRHQRLLVEGSTRRGDTSLSDKLAGAGSRLLEAWIRRPQEQAAFAFIWKTLVRSRGHRLLLLAWAGLAAGWIINGILDMPTPSLKNQGVYGMIVTASPLALAVLAVVALRHLFSLPVTHSARGFSKSKGTMTPRPGFRRWIVSLSAVALRRSALPDFPRLSRCLDGSAHSSSWCWYSSPPRFGSKRFSGNGASCPSRAAIRLRGAPSLLRWCAMASRARCLPVLRV
jgi:hypothetical protein